MERRILIVFLSLLPLLASAQEKPDFHVADSISYRYYVNGEWDNVIKQGEKMLSQGLDYKFLRQRLGHAYFVKRDFTEAKVNFKKALRYDSYDPFTNEYLFYSFLNTGTEEYAGLQEKRLPEELANKLQIKKISLVENIDAEINYKYPESTLRTGAIYYRFGAGSKLGHRIRLYQSFSRYTQAITIQSSAKINVSQPEYYARLGWNVSESLNLYGAYHHINVQSGTLDYKGNLFLIDASPDLGRLILEAEGSFFKIKGEEILQAGVQSGYIFPGTRGFYLKGKGSIISHSGEAHLVIGSNAGLRILKNTWFDAGFASGNMDRYNDFKGMYVYNSYDPLIFRSGATINYYAGSRLVLWGNFSFERKEYNEDNTFKYNQFSYLGGIRWKI